MILQYVLYFIRLEFCVLFRKFRSLFIVQKEQIIDNTYFRFLCYALATSRETTLILVVNSQSCK